MIKHVRDAMTSETFVLEVGYVDILTKLACADSNVVQFISF